MSDESPHRGAAGEDALSSRGNDSELSEGLPEQLISDELIRERIRRMLPAAAQASRLSGILGHPLTSVIVGFMLTGVIGWGLTTGYAEHQRTLADRQAQYDGSNKAIQDVARLIYHRYACATMLLSSLRREAPLDELRMRKGEYDTTVVEWMTNLDATLRIMQGISGDVTYGKLQLTVDKVLGQNLNKIDECLTDAYDDRLSDHSDAHAVIKALNDCRVDERLTLVRQTNSAIIDELSSRAAKWRAAR